MNKLLLKYPSDIFYTFFQNCYNLLYYGIKARLAKNTIFFEGKYDTTNLKEEIDK